MFQEPHLELFLIDTTGENDIHLNDVLVNQSHAMFNADLLEVFKSDEEDDHDAQISRDEREVCSTVKLASDSLPASSITEEKSMIHPSHVFLTNSSNLGGNISAASNTPASAPVENQAQVTRLKCLLVKYNKNFKMESALELVVVLSYKCHFCCL